MAATHHVVVLESASTPYEIVPALGGNGRDVTIQNNNSAANLFIGGEGVNTEGYGFKLLPGAAISFELDGADALFAAADSYAYAWILSVKLEKSI
jgi:hypothetical protein